VDAQTATLVNLRLELIEKVLEDRHAWLGPPKDRVTVLVVSSDETYRSIARSHGVMDPQTSAFACSAGEVVVHFRADEWGLGPQEGWVLSPRSAPVSEAIFRRRLEEHFGAQLAHTRLEDGLARLFVEQAARELGEAPEASRRQRDDLLDAFLPLFLGGERTLAKTALATGAQATERGSKKGFHVTGAPALNYAVARYLLEADGGSRLPLARTILEHAAAPVSSSSVDAAFDDARTRLEGDEEKFERWLRDATANALLDAIEAEPVQAARWEARSALRLISAMDLDDEPGASPDARARRIGRARLEVKRIATVRFTEEYDARLVATKRGHGGLERVVTDAKKDLDRRAAGYGHPALEEGRARLGQALQERLRELTVGRSPG
jgi:hypothetical protein